MRLNDFADNVEAIMKRVDLPGEVTGGQCDQRHAYLHIAWQPGIEPLKRVAQCQTLSAEMKTQFGCVVAGVDGGDPWRIYVRWDGDYLELQQ